MSFVRLVCGLALLAVSCSRAPETNPPRTLSSASSSPAAAAQPAAPPTAQPPSTWAGAAWTGVRADARRLGISITDTSARPIDEPKPLVVEPASGRLPGSLDITDLAFDARRRIVYVGTCCEPGSGHLLRVDAAASAPAFAQDDQGFAVDVAGALSTFARADTWGTLVARASADEEPDVQAEAGVADVAVDGRDPTRVIALVDSKRLRAVVPTAPAPVDASPDPGLLVRERTASGTWTDTRYPLPRDATYCRVVPLRDGAVGLLTGTIDRDAPWRCTGDTLVIYDTARKQPRAKTVTLPARVRHLSIEDSSTFLIFTTTEGAVGWQTLEGRAGMLAARGFAAADW